jgi:hypothetical protein
MTPTLAQGIRAYDGKFMYSSKAHEICLFPGLWRIEVVSVSLFTRVEMDMWVLLNHSNFADTYLITEDIYI